MRNLLFAAVTIAALAIPGVAQSEDATPVLPADARLLSEIIAKVEKRDQFHYIDEIRWNEDRYYQVTYFTNDKAKVEINYNPVTGEPR